MRMGEDTMYVYYERANSQFRFIEELSYWKPVDLNVILVLSVSIIWLKQEQIFSK